MGLIKSNKIEQNTPVPSGLNSDIAELLGYTKEYLNTVAGLELPSTVIQLATEIAIQSAKLNVMCAKFDKLLSAAKILDIQRKQIEWAEMIAAKRAERAAKERQKIGRKLRGGDKKLYQKTGLLPEEYQSSLEKTFMEFLLRRNK